MAVGLCIEVILGLVVTLCLRIRSLVRKRKAAKEDLGQVKMVDLAEETGVADREKKCGARREVLAGAS